MANDCYYDMKVIGTNVAVEKFVKIIQGDDERALGRVFSADTYNDVQLEDNLREIMICGYCAWSVYSSMTENGYCGEVDSATSLEQESLLLQLQIEVFSEEEGMGFREHYLYNKGECLINETSDIRYFYPEDFSDVHELNKIHGTDFEEYEFTDALENGYGLLVPADIVFKSYLG